MAGLSLTTFLNILFSEILVLLNAKSQVKLVPVQLLSVKWALFPGI